MEREEAYEQGYAAYERGDLTEAERCWTAAADAGDADAAFNLGNLLADRGAHEEALRRYEQAFAAGHVAAANNAGALLGERDDLDAAEQWYTRGAEAGDATAMFNLAEYRLRRHRDQDGAERWASRAVAAGEDDALAVLRAIRRADVQRILDVVTDAGGDLARPRELSHWLYVGGETAARRVADALTAYTTRVEPPDDEGAPWLVVAERTMPLDPDDVLRTRSETADAVLREGGEYDGWEVESGA